jgi:hypothetical protein
MTTNPTAAAPAHAPVNRSITGRSTPIWRTPSHNDMSPMCPQLYSFQRMRDKANTSGVGSSSRIGAYRSTRSQLDREDICRCRHWRRSRPSYTAASRWYSFGAACDRCHVACGPHPGSRSDRQISQRIDKPNLCDKREKHYKGFTISGSDLPTHAFSGSSCVRRSGASVNPRISRRWNVAYVVTYSPSASGKSSCVDYILLTRYASCGPSETIHETDPPDCHFEESIALRYVAF